MDGGNNIGQFSIGPINPAYQVADVEDFNGDGRADILFRSNDDAVIWMMNGATNIAQLGPRNNEFHLSGGASPVRHRVFEEAEGWDVDRLGRRGNGRKPSRIPGNRKYH